MPRRAEAEQTAEEADAAGAPATQIAGDLAQGLGGGHLGGIGLEAASGDQLAVARKGLLGMAARLARELALVKRAAGGGNFARRP